MSALTLGYCSCGSAFACWRSQLRCASPRILPITFQMVDGVDDVMKWWFYITVPIAFILMSGRVVGNWLEDWGNFKAGNPIIKQAVIGGDV